MTLNLKGLAALLAVGLFLVVPAAAQATPLFGAGAYPATVQGESAAVVIGTDGGNIECFTTTFDGTLSAASSTLDLTPIVSNCKAWGFVNPTISTQGCGYRFHATEKQALDQYKAHLGIKCPTAGGIIWSAGTCSIEIKPQEGLTTVDLDNDTGAPNRLTLDFEVSGLAYTVTKDGLGCPLTGTGATTNGTITSDAILLKASNSGKEVGLAVSGE